MICLVTTSSAEQGTEKLSATVAKGRKAQIRDRVGDRGLSAYVDAAIARQLERDALADLLAELAEVHGPVGEDETEAAMAAWPSAQR